MIPQEPIQDDPEDQDDQDEIGAYVELRPGFVDKNNPNKNETNKLILEEMSYLGYEFIIMRMLALPPGIDLKDPRISGLLTRIKTAKENWEALSSTPSEKPPKQQLSDLERLELPREIQVLKEFEFSVLNVFDKLNPQKTEKEIKMEELIDELNQLTNYLNSILLDLPDDAFNDEDKSIQAAINRLRFLYNNYGRPTADQQSGNLEE